MKLTRMSRSKNRNNFILGLFLATAAWYKYTLQKVPSITTQKKVPDNNNNSDLRSATTKTEVKRETKPEIKPEKPENNPKIKTNPNRADLTINLGSNPCPDSTELGTGNEGGWYVCDPLDLKMKASKNECIVYSYGIADNFSFDKAIHEWRCQAHGFDPSTYGLQSKPQYEAMGGVYHNVGLGIADGTVEAGKAPFRWPGIGYLTQRNTDPWVLERVSTTMKKLGHNRISLLKVDAEGAEWDAMKDIIHNVQWDHFATELHFPGEYKVNLLWQGDQVNAASVIRTGEKALEPADPAWLDRIPLLHELLQVASVWKIIPNAMDAQCINVYFKRK